MLNLVRNTDTRIVTQVQELATNNDYLLHIEGLTDLTQNLQVYPTIEIENDRYVSFIINTSLNVGDYAYTFYDGNGVDLTGDFEKLETGLLKITK